GMSSMVKNVKTGINNIGTKIKDGFTDFFGIKSPSRLMMSLSKHIPGGAIKGMESMKRKLQNAAGSMSQWMTPDTSELGLSGKVNSINSQISGNMQVNHTNENDGHMVSLLNKIANSNQVIVLDTGELVGGTYREYDRMGGSQLELTERWGR